MLEERLSNTYSQHTIGGYNLPGQRHTSNTYPSMPPNLPSGPGGAESFYTSSQQEPHGRSQSTYNYATIQQYPNYDKRASVAASNYVGPDQRNGKYNQIPSQPQRSGSYSMPSPYPQQFSGPATEVLQQDTAHGPTPSQQQLPFAPSEPLMASSADANVSFYYGNAPQNQQAPPHQGLQEQSQTPYPNIQSPPQRHHLLHPAQSSQQFTPQSLAPHQQPQGIPQQPLPQYNLPQPGPSPQAPPQQAYWQAQLQNAVPPQSWQQAPTATQNNYTQDSFPTAPHHAPQPQPVPVEESLIEF